jgi:hypothetical protein
LTTLTWTSHVLFLILPGSDHLQLVRFRFRSTVGSKSHDSLSSSLVSHLPSYLVYSDVTSSLGHPLSPDQRSFRHSSDLSNTCPPLDIFFGARAYLLHTRPLSLAPHLHSLPCVASIPCIHYRKATRCWRLKSVPTDFYRGHRHRYQTRKAVKKAVGTWKPSTGQPMPTATVGTKKGRRHRGVRGDGEATVLGLGPMPRATQFFFCSMHTPGIAFSVCKKNIWKC